YQWEMSTDGGQTFVPVENAIAKDYNPPTSLYDTTTYRRVAISAIGCGMAISNWVTVVIDQPSFLISEIPNVIFPNGSIKNSTWGVSHMGLEGTVKIRVFNKNGQIIYASNNPQKEWDGTYKGKLVPKGNYFFSIENQEGKRISGSIKVIY